MKTKTGPSLLRRLNIVSSIRGKITFILLSLAVMAGAAGYFNYKSFDHVAGAVEVMTQRDLPQLEQSSELIAAAGKTKDAMISILISEDQTSLEQASAQVQETVERLTLTVKTLPENSRDSFQGELGRVSQTLDEAISARASSFDYSEKVNGMASQLQVLTTQLQKALLETADDAHFNISVQGEDTITKIEDTLLDLTENKFATLQSLLEIRAEINFISGVALAMATSTDRSTLSILTDLATSSNDRLQGVMPRLDGTDAGLAVGEELQSIAMTLSQAIEAGTSGRRVDQSSVLSSRQQADALLAAAVDDMVFELTIAADDAATGNRDAIQGLLDNEVAVINKLLELNSWLSVFQIEALKIVNASTVEQVQVAERAMQAKADTLLAFTSFSNQKFAEQIDQIVALAVPESGLAFFRSRSIEADNRATEAAVATVDAVLRIAGQASILGLQSQTTIAEQAQVIASDATDVKQNLQTFGWIAVGLIIATLALNHFLIVRPLNAISMTTERLSKGDMSPVTGFDRASDEIARIARALTVFRDGLVEKQDMERIAEQERAESQASQVQAVEAVGNGLSKLAQGNLVYRIGQDLPDGYEQLKTDFNLTAETLNDTVLEVSNVAESIKNGSSEISQASDNLAQRTENQAAKLEETAAALEELTANVRSAAAGAKDAEATTVEARDEATKSGEIVENAVQAMKDIEDSSSQIAQIIGVIDDIAFQTNLLALNAGVEAARAGEAGSGFAVVASEVRALSLRTTDAAHEIKQLISKSSHQVETGVDSVARAGDALRAIVERVTTISALVSSIAVSTNEQAAGLTEANTAVSHLDQVTQQNAAMVEETSAAGHLLSSDAKKLGALMQNFQAAKTMVSDTDLEINVTTRLAS